MTRCVEAINNIVFYLLKTMACDLEEVIAIKSTDAYNYEESGNAGCRLANADRSRGCIFIKGDAEQPQVLSAPSHKSWVGLELSGAAATADCSCMTGAARVSSQIEALLWKMQFAAQLGLDGTASTDNNAE